MALSRSATFVLVHGAAHGGWCWRGVADILRSQGHVVYTPTLTGLGEREHLLNPQIGLHTHIADVEGVLRFESLRDVFLVGHSYGGMVITGVADRMHDRLARLIYLDAPRPMAGESLEYLDGEPITALRQSSRTVNGTEVVLSPDVCPPSIYGVTGPEAAWMRDRLTAHPWRCFTDRLVIDNPEAVQGVPRTSVNCQPGMQRRPQRVRVRMEDADEVHDLVTGHDAMITAPNAVAEQLARAVASTQSRP